jgi:hypothetical protein
MLSLAMFGIAFELSVADFKASIDAARLTHTGWQRTFVSPYSE